MHLANRLVIIAVAVIYEDYCVAVSLLSNRLTNSIIVDTATATAAAINTVDVVWIGCHVVDAWERGSAADAVIIVVAVPIC